MDNLTERPPLDHEAISELMLRIIDQVEAQPEFEDRPMFTVYVLYDTDDLMTALHLEATMKGMGTPLTSGRYGAQPFLGPKMFDPSTALAAGFDSPAESLYNFAMNIGFADTSKVRHHLGHDHIVGIRGLLQQPGIIGFAAFSEAIGFRRLTPLIKSVLDAGVPVETLKGSELTNVAFAADMAGMLHRVSRWSADGTVITEHSDRACNEMTTGLRILARFASGAPMPTSGEEFQAAFHAQCTDDD